MEMNRNKGGEINTYNDLYFVFSRDVVGRISPRLIGTPSAIRELIVQRREMGHRHTEYYLLRVGCTRASCRLSGQGRFINGTGRFKTGGIWIVRVEPPGIVGAVEPAKLKRIMDTAESEFPRQVSFILKDILAETAEELGFRELPEIMPDAFI